MAKQPTLTTPVGTAKYPRLNTPDTHYNENGEYRVSLVVTKAEADAFKKQIQPLYDAAYATEVQTKGKELKKSDSFPVMQDSDGDWIIKAKLKAKVISRDGTEHKLNVGLFDSQGNPHSRDEIVGGGSKCKVACRPRFWFVAAIGFGCTLELNAVQILELAEYTPGEKSASSFGFTAVEGGYVNNGETFENTLNEESQNEEEELLEANF